MSAPHDLPNISPFLLRWFTWYGRRFVKRHFNAVRIVRDSPAFPKTDAPLVIVLNHPSWWDPMIGLLLANAQLADRKHYAPIFDATLAQYKFFARLGYFAVKPTHRGALDFLRQSAAILQQPRATLWITAQGNFTDARVRPIQLARGIGHLSLQNPKAQFVPLALEIAYWHERTPEALVRIGDPIDFSSNSRSAADRTHHIARSLERTCDALAADAMTQDPQRFGIILSGSRGVGGVYDSYRHTAAIVHGKPFDPSHDAHQTENPPPQNRPIGGDAQ
jgi:1-acyl-sn-glycerol-3-phosphate acyltransferase